MGAAISSSILKYQCTSFGGGSAYVLVGNFSTYNFERTDSFSVSCWVKWTTTTLVSFINKLLPASSPSESGWDLYMSSGFWGFTLKNNPTSNMIGVQTSLTYNDGKWHHLVMTYGGTSLASGVALYVDGVQVTAPAFIDALSSTMQTTEPLRIGTRPSYSPAMGALLGAMDVAIYNKKLTSGEVATIHNKHCPPDLTAVGPTGNLVGYWLLGQHAGDLNLASKKTSYPSCPDAGSGAHNGTMTNMSSSNLITRK